jgi:molybdopterin-guanine dinucleotide biosynthesis protein A
VRSINVTAIVLAGGRSSRFGSDKLAVDVGGRSLLAATIAAVAPIVDGTIVAGPELPREVNGGIGDVPIALVPDAESFGGPLAALANVLSYGAPDGEELLLVVGGDMPGLVADVLELMLARLGAGLDVDAVVLDRPPRVQALPLAVRRGAGARAAVEALATGDRSLVALLRRLRVETIPAAEWTPLDPTGDTLDDIDRPGDLEQFATKCAKPLPEA